MADAPQFAWTGDEDTGDVLSYATGLGARDTDGAGDRDKRVLALSIEQARALVTVYRSRWPSVLVQEVPPTEAEAAKLVLSKLELAIDRLLASPAVPTLDVARGSEPESSEGADALEAATPGAGAGSGAGAGGGARTSSCDHSDEAGAGRSSGATSGTDPSASACDSPRWFFKTNRHSVKDAPIDHPTAADTALFAEELRRRGYGRPPDGDPPRFPPTTDVDSIDFGPAFEAFCAARIRATAASTGAEVIDLLTRSSRAADDLALQLAQVDGEGSAPSEASDTGAGTSSGGWDCYLAFMVFEDDVANTPLHEFRCFVSRTRLRCITQYSYLHRCPIPRAAMADAGAAIASSVHALIPTLPAGTVDAAVDVRCVPQAGGGFQVGLVEVNPLGPGCVWGLLAWERDREWLLGSAPPPKAETRMDNVGNTSSFIHIDCPGLGPAKHGHRCDSGAGTEAVSSTEAAADPSACAAWPVVVSFTAAHSMGFSMGGLAHIPTEFMAVLWEEWQLEPVFKADTERRQVRRLRGGGTASGTRSNVKESSPGGSAFGSRCSVM